MPVIVKLTPNITDVRQPARAAKKGGGDAVSLINTINSIMNIDLDAMTPDVAIDGKGTHGGMCGPAVKPIALSMVSEIARDSVCAGLPISAIGGITTWRDAAEFLLLGATSLQVCTAAMHYGFRIIEDLCDGLSNWMDSKGFATIADFRGKSLNRISEFKDFDLSFRAVARIDEKLCIRCNLCYVACNDTAHQCIDRVVSGESALQPMVREPDCVGCRLCYNVCPVENCIKMVELPSGRDPVTWDQISQARPEVTNDWEAMKRYRQEKGIEIH